MHWLKQGGEPLPHLLSPPHAFQTPFPTPFILPRELVLFKVRFENPRPSPSPIFFNTCKTEVEEA